MAGETVEYKGIQLRDTPSNPFRVMGQEGQILIVKKGNVEGPLDGFVHSLKDLHFQGEDLRWSGSEVDSWEIVSDFKNGERTFTPPNRGMLREQFGIVWVGFGRALGEVHVRQAKWEIPTGATTAQMVNKDRIENSIFYHHVLGIVMPNVESRGNFENTIKLNITVEIANPYKALFLAGGWESNLDGAVHGAIRDYISDMRAEKIREEKENGGMKQRVMDLNDNPDGFYQKFGVRIYDVRFVSWDTTNPDQETERALRLKEVNLLLLEATAPEAQRIRELGDAHAYAAEKLTAAAGSPEAAAQIRAAELIADGVRGASVISIGGVSVPVTVPVPPKKP